MHNHIWIQICWIKHVRKFLSFFNYFDDEIGVFFFNLNSNLIQSDFCVCGNTFSYPNTNSSSICTDGCSGNINEICGGYGINGEFGNDFYSIYSLKHNLC